MELGAPLFIAGGGDREVLWGSGHGAVLGVLEGASGGRLVIGRVLAMLEE
jgi:hypothetical protein